MNKKVLTLCAGLLLAGNSVAFGEVFRVTSADAGYQAVGGTFSYEGVISRDQSSAVGRMEFPTVSPFAIKTDNGAKPITELKHVNGNVAEDQYFQFVVGAADPAASTASGKEVLTMVWVKDNDGGQGHYELQVENVENANIPSNRIILDRTLWKVTANKLSGTNTLVYQLQNKATDAILQISIEGASDISGVNGAKEVTLEIVAGQTQWRWAEGEKAAAGTSSAIQANTPVLQNQFSAQFSNGTTLYLAKKFVGGTSSPSAVKLVGLLLNSNLTFDRNNPITASNGDIYYSVNFEAWEANPIILTAAQINSELGKELLDNGQSNGQFKFTFDPDVQGEENVMMKYAFKAVDAIAGKDRVPGDAADGFVRFQNTADDKQFLYVDTAYYDENVNGRYDLRLKVDEILYSRYAVAADGLTVVDGKLHNTSGELSADAMYKNGNYASVKTYVQMKRQSNFRPIFYPSTQSLRLQAEMLYKADKNDLAKGESWWEQMSDDATAYSSLYMDIAEAAEDPTIDVVAKKGAARGYYPSYAFATTNVNGGFKGTALTSYKTVYNNGVDNPTTSYKNGYVTAGEGDSGYKCWNAVGNLHGTAWASDPASSGTAPYIYSNIFRTAQSNLVRLTSLTNGHTALTADKYDVNDETYSGLNTYISIDGLRQNSDIPSVVDIPEGFYYIQNANKNSTQLANVGDYRYEDLAATNAMFTYWNNATEEWDRGVSGKSVEPTAIDKETTTLGETIKDNTGLNAATHKADKANKGNLVYSSEKLAIPSAQWYIKGNGGHYVMINRESGRQWGTVYWWKTSEDGVYVNQATYTDAAGQQQTYRDTIRISAVPVEELAPHAGYLWMDNKEAMADTTIYNVGMTSLGDVKLSLSVNEDGTMIMTPDSTGAYKLERVLVKDVDPYSNSEKKTTDLYYGYFPADADTAKYLLTRAKYYIYKDEVSANSGIEPESIKTRQYITLDGGKYKLNKVTVQFDNDLYTTEVDGKNVRREFYVKQITPKANQYVLVDPEVVSTVSNNTGSKTAYGARVFVNQLTAELQPGSLISDGYANSYANSILDFNKISGQNYADIRGGKDRANVKFSIEGDANWLLSENSNVEGAHVGLLELRQLNDKISNSIFVDTANVSDPAYPRFLLGVRNVDSVEVSNIPNHNKHILTKAAYLVNMIDSAATNNAYKYVNRDFNNTEWYRLGFVNATHKGSTLTIDKTGKPFDLTADGMSYVTFAFRYVDTDRESFYIETQYNATKKGWLKIHNGVAVVTPNIQEAEVFTATLTDETATANEEIATSSVVVAGTNGAVVVKGAEGKNVIVSTILGKVVANEVVSSDNATIAAPAGVVVVSVDGESFKVVVK